jgi:hypothetical protein
MIRKMGDFEVIQRTSDSMFNATLLIKQWNRHSGMKKEIDDFFYNENTKQFVSALIIEENLDTQNSPHDGKGCKLAYCRSRANKGNNAGTWMHPILFIKFAMWLNPAFEVKVIKFVYDEMIKYRHEAGDEYRALSSAVQKIVPPDFMQAAMKKIGEALNWIVFGNHEHGIRNKFGDEKTQRELSLLEKKVADLISEGFICSYSQLVNYLRKLYNEKKYPKVFIEH